MTDSTVTLFSGAFPQGSSILSDMEANAAAAASSATNAAASAASAAASASSAAGSSADAAAAQVSASNAATSETNAATSANAAASSASTAASSASTASSAATTASTAATNAGNSATNAATQATAAASSASAAASSATAAANSAANSVLLDGSRTMTGALKVTNTVFGQQFASKYVDSADATGVSPAGAIINTAITTLNSIGGGTLVLPAGTFLIDSTAASITAKSNVTIAGQGMGVTTLLIDDTGATPASGGFTATAGLQNFHVRDLTIQGKVLTVPALGKHLVSLQNGGSNISFVRVEFRESRQMALAVQKFDRVQVLNCRVIRTNLDGIALWDCSNVDVAFNYIKETGDDAISLHSNDTAAAPVRSSIRVAYNTIEDSQGIVSLGAKGVVITGNVMRRMQAYGLMVTVGNGFAQGHTPLFGAHITDNVIEDVYQRSDTGTNREQYYVRVGGSVAQAGTGASVPGRPVSGTGAVTSLYGSGTGNFYANNNADTSVPSPGGYWVRIEGNTLVRTLPAVAQYSSWGYGDGTGVFQGHANGVTNVAITEAMLNTKGIVIDSALSNSLISRNLIQTTGSRGIEFSNSVLALNDLDFNGLDIVDNKIVDFTDAGVFWPTAATSNQRILIAGNRFDGDPQFRNTNRGTGGTWAASGFPAGVYAAFLSGATIQNNHFRNLCAPVTEGAGQMNVLRGNVVYCAPSAAGFSVANSGVGTLPASFEGEYVYLTEDCDPRSSTFGKRTADTLVSSSTMPSAGAYVIGHFVRNTAPAAPAGAVLLGWLRLTTGSGHVLGTDWLEVRGFGKDNTGASTIALQPNSGAKSELRLYNGSTLKWFLNNNPAAGDHLTLWDQAGGRAVLDVAPGGNVTLATPLVLSALPTNATNDAAAATAGVPVKGVYRNGSVLMVRVS